MSYSESEPDFNFIINSLSTFVPTFSESNSESESDFSSMFVNLDVCVFFYPIFTLF